MTVAYPLVKRIYMRFTFHCDHDPLSSKQYYPAFPEPGQNLFQNPHTICKTPVIRHLGCLREGGAFNDGIEVWQRNDSQGRLLVRKVFRRSDLPHHAQREVNILRQLAACPYTVNMFTYEIGRTSGDLFMECCGKGTVKALLREHIQRWRLIPESFVWHVFFSLVEAVWYMQYGPTPNRSWNWIYHRDLHPGNIFITGGRLTGLRIVVGDFGSAISGTWEDGGRVHMQAEDFGIPESQMNDRSDIYQIGLVIVAMCQLTLQPLTVMRPAHGSRPRQLAGAQYTDALNRLLDRCLRTDPNDRIHPETLRAEVRREVVDNGRSDNRDPRCKLLFPTMRIYER